MSTIKTRMSYYGKPKVFQPQASNFPVNLATMTKYPRDYQKAEPFVNPFSKAGIERHNEEMKKRAEDDRKFAETMDLAFAKFEEQKKEVCIFSLSELKLGEEVKADEHDDDDEDAEEDVDNLQEELLEEVGELPTDGVTKETEELVRMALQSVDINCNSKPTPAS